jgi:cell division protein FtsW
VWTLLLTRNLIYAVVAVLAMIVASRINVRQVLHTRGLMNPLFLMLGVSLLLVGLTLLPGLGKDVHGASRWLHLGPRGWGLSFQPSEVLKWVMIPMMAWWCARRRGVMGRFFHGLLPALALVGFACGLVVIEDLGTAVLIGSVSACLLLAGGAKLWQMMLCALPAVMAIVAAIWHSPYRINRLLAFLNPWEDPQGIGYHPIQSMLAIAMGGLTGRGLGNGLQKFGYLPEDTTDFIFAIICEEMGIVGAIMVIGLYLALMWLGLSIIRDCKDVYGRLLGLGVLLTVGIQAVINLAVVTVVVPTKGIALPLISSGGTGWILTAFALGLLVSLDEANRIEQPEVDDETGLLPVVG